MTARVCILNFHGLGIPHAGVEPDEAPYWVSVDRFKSILDKVALRAEQGQKLKITFDDGNRSDLEIGVPELRARGLTGHFFVLTGRCEDPLYLSESEIRDMAASEMEIGLHGKDHVDWRKLDASGLSVETKEARDTVARITGQAINTVGIPFGGYNRTVVSHLKGLGFTEIYTSDGGHTSDQRRLRHRSSITAHMSEGDIEAILDGEVPMMTRLKRDAKSWLKEYVV